MRDIVQDMAIQHGLPSDGLNALALAVLSEVMKECQSWDYTDDIEQVFDAEIRELESWRLQRTGEEPV